MLTLRLKLMIIRIGDTKRSEREEHLRKLKDLIIKEKLDNFLHIAMVFSRCILLMPHKLQLYASLLCLVAKEDHELAIELWKMFCDTVSQEKALF